MTDPTEGLRRVATMALNAQAIDKETDRDRLTKEYGKVWDTEEVSKDFSITSFLAPFVGATAKVDIVVEGVVVVPSGSDCTLMFQHSPRFYFAPDPV